MKRMPLFPAACAALAALVFASTARADTAAPKLEAAFDGNGLSALKVGGTNVLANPLPRVYVANFRKADDKTPLADRAAAAKEILFSGDLKTPPVRAFDEAARRLTATYAWGIVTVEYKPGASSLDMKMTIENKTADILDQWTLSLLELQLPEEPNWPRISEALYFGQPTVARSANNLAAPLVVAGGTGQFWLIGCSPETARPLTLSLNSGGKGKETLCSLTVQAGGDKLLYDDVYDTRPLAAGASDSFTVSLRFADVAASPVAAADDCCKAYAAAHPLRLKWADRRPIIRSFIGDGLPQRKDEPSMAVPPAAATDEFRQKMLKVADGLIATMKAADAQGMIVWNIEGGPGSIKYVGDPHMVEILCPEMNAVADDYFKKFLDAGLRTGLCLRPSHIDVHKTPEGKPFFTHTHDANENPVEVISGKIAYAKKRWGCTIFYIDTNSVYRKRGSSDKTTGALMSADQWDEICRRNPGVLLVPEHSYIRYYTSSAGYDQMDMGCAISPPIVKQTWPGAFKCVTIDNPPQKQWNTLVNMWRSGDVILFDGGELNIRTVANARREAGYLDVPAPEACRTGDANALMALIDGNDARTRFFASQALGKVRTAAAYEKVLSLTADADWLVRKNAVVALGQYGDANVTARLLALMSDPNANIDAIGVQAFAAIGPSAVAPLVESLQKPSKTAAAALQGLAAIGNPQAIQTVIEVMENKDFNINLRGLALRLVAEKAERKDATAFDALLRTLANKDLRMQASSYLPRLRDARTIPAVEAALAAEKAAASPDAKFIERLEATLKELTRK